MRWLALLIVGCGGGDPASAPCPSGEVLACRAEGDCRCGAQCTAATRCPTGDGGLTICAGPAGATDGACVDARWLVGVGGRLRCGSGSCTLDDACVDWGRDGVGCAVSCEANVDCESGCCVELSDGADGLRRVCAPSELYRCLPGSPAGRGCSPPCGDGRSCVWSEGAPTCLVNCSGDDDCGRTCCAMTTGGVPACAASRAECGTTLRSACVSLDGCVAAVSGVRGTHCADVDSVEVRVRNNCDVPADIELCYARRDGTCACGIHRAVAPGALAEPAFWACDVTGAFGMSARASGDPAGCHPHRCN